MADSDYSLFSDAGSRADEARVGGPIHGNIGAVGHMGHAPSPTKHNTIVDIAKDFNIILPQMKKAQQQNNDRNKKNINNNKFIFKDIRNKNGQKEDHTNNEDHQDSDSKTDNNEDNTTNSHANGGGGGVVGRNHRSHSNMSELSDASMTMDDYVARKLIEEKYGKPSDGKRNDDFDWGSMFDSLTQFENDLTHWGSSRPPNPYLNRVPRRRPMPTTDIDDIKFKKSLSKSSPSTTTAIEQFSKSLNQTKTIQQNNNGNGSNSFSNKNNNSSSTLLNSVSLDNLNFGSSAISNNSNNNNNNNNSNSNNVNNNDNQELQDQIWQSERIEEDKHQIMNKIKTLMEDRREGLIDRAKILNNLAASLQETKNQEEAYRTYEKSLCVKKIVLGETHPSVGHTLYNMSCLLISNKQHEDALILLQNTLDIYKESFGPEHQASIEVAKHFKSVKEVALQSYQAQSSSSTTPEHRNSRLLQEEIHNIKKEQHSTKDMKNIHPPNNNNNNNNDNNNLLNDDNQHVNNLNRLTPETLLAQELQSRDKNSISLQSPYYCDNDDADNDEQRGPSIASTMTDLSTDHFKLQDKEIPSSSSSFNQHVSITRRYENENKGNSINNLQPIDSNSNSNSNES